VDVPHCTRGKDVHDLHAIRTWRVAINAHGTALAIEQVFAEINGTVGGQRSAAAQNAAGPLQTGERRDLSVAINADALAERQENRAVRERQYVPVHEAQRALSLPQQCGGAFPERCRKGAEAAERRV
jgi:hypothetical protein